MYIVTLLVITLYLLVLYISVSFLKSYTFLHKKASFSANGLVLGGLFCIFAYYYKPSKI